MIELNCTNKIDSKKSNVKSNVTLESTFLGLQDYKKSIQMQADLLLLAQQSKHSYIVGLEHPAVLTLGYRASAEYEVLFNNSLPVEKAPRGGLATVHSEGQLVVYPVINLRTLNLGARDYVQLLLETTRELLQSLKLKSFIDEKTTGLYTQIGKIAFCGVQIKNGITQHGLSLNVRNDLSLFANIRPCGVENLKFDSLSNYSVSYTLSELYQLWVEIFRTKLY